MTTFTPPGGTIAGPVHVERIAATGEPGAVVELRHQGSGHRMISIALTPKWSVVEQRYLGEYSEDLRATQLRAPYGIEVKLGPGIKSATITTRPFDDREVRPKAPAPKVCPACGQEIRGR